MTALVRFTKVSLPYGWLGNMAPFPVAHEGKTYRTTEALFQALRFDQETIRDSIRNEKSPMAAKMRAKTFRSQMVVAPQGEQDVANMDMVLRLKLHSHPRLQAMLAETGDARIIEDCSRRPRGSGLFWGAALVDNEWRGENVLGKLWMAIRDSRAAS
ncbi:MAG: NADAR family protein [Alphaproteobacteria bacterium]|nr:NADAR family protein [Alphaproteobacteria bacterium]MBV8406876.1 NADAR family protein [Alphaproteobacteria bacterium]